MVTNRDRKLFGLLRKNSKSCSGDWHRWRFWSAFRHFGTHFEENFRMSKSSWMIDPTRPREMPSCSAINLAQIRRSSKISSWIWSIISGLVTVLGRPGRGASQVEKSPRLNWVIPFFMVTYDGACFPNVSVRMAWIFFGALPCRKKTWWQLASRCCWNRARRLTCLLSLCSKKRLAIRHINRRLFPTTLSVPSYDIGKWVGLRTYQHPLAVIYVSDSTDCVIIYHKYGTCFSQLYGRPQSFRTHETKITIADFIVDQNYVP